MSSAEAELNRGTLPLAVHHGCECASAKLQARAGATAALFSARAKPAPTPARR
jgi:hypothetical protein